MRVVGRMVGDFTSAKCRGFPRSNAVGRELGEVVIIAKLNALLGGCVTGRDSELRGCSSRAPPLLFVCLQRTGSRPLGPCLLGTGVAGAIIWSVRPALAESSALPAWESLE